MVKASTSKYIVGKDIDLNLEIVLDSDGTRITEKRAEEIVQEVLNSVGRPSLTGLSRHSPEVKARVPEKLKVALNTEAKRRGQTPSAVLRLALEEFLTNT